MPNKRRRLQGRVTSNKMDKTVVVTVDKAKPHPLYGKVVRYTKKYMAHDENNEAQIGDVVRIVESRPISKQKRWVIESFVERVSDVEAALASDAEARQEES
ncbi:MAG: 30S ribosomal protein S17 [Anaerolineae bacterium]|nr:30S ribosomal protein S17 [Anaerolineae bacterium]